MASADGYKRKQKKRKAVRLEETIKEDFGMEKRDFIMATEDREVWEGIIASKFQYHVAVSFCRFLAQIFALSLLHKGDHMSLCFLFFFCLADNARRYLTFLVIVDGQ